MSNTHLLRATAVLSLLTGIFLTISSGVAMLQGNVSGQGATLLDRPASVLPQSSLHAAAPMEKESAVGAEGQLLFGMALIVLGFILYGAAIVSHRRTHGRAQRLPDEVPVPIRVKRKKPVFYWMEIRI